MKRQSSKVQRYVGRDGGLLENPESVLRSSTGGSTDVDLARGASRACVEQSHVALSRRRRYSISVVPVDRASSTLVHFAKIREDTESQATVPQSFWRQVAPSLLRAPRMAWRSDSTSLGQRRTCVESSSGKTCTSKSGSHARIVGPEESSLDILVAVNMQAASCPSWAAFSAHEAKLK